MHRAHVDVDPEGRAIVKRTGEEIRDGEIVEFAFIVNHRGRSTPMTTKSKFMSKSRERDVDDDGESGVLPVSVAPEKCWVPLRVRHDKTTCNAATKTAYPVWESIQDPITEDVLTGENEREFRKLSEGRHHAPPSGDALYYARSEKRDRLDTASYPMNDFHNGWIKWRTLLRPFSGRVVSLFDLGTGQGGDVHKWFQMDGLRRVLGIDLVEESLVRAGSGAYARLENEIRRSGDDRRQRPIVAFAAMDAGKPLFRDDAVDVASTASSESMRRLSRALWDGGKDGDVRTTRYLSAETETETEIEMGTDAKANTDAKALDPLRGMALKPFDLVTSQFAVHYFFENDDTLRTFARNVSTALKMGGFFAGACLDGRRVRRLLSDTHKGDHVQGVDRSAKTGEQRLMWRISKMYDEDDAEGARGGERTGLKINVYMEKIGQAFDEFLVDFALFVRVMKEHGMVPVTRDEAAALGLPEDHEGLEVGGSFEDAFADMQHDVVAKGGEGRVDDKRVRAALTMTEKQKQYSFLNRWFVFKKTSDVK